MVKKNKGFEKWLFDLAREQDTKNQVRASLSEKVEEKDVETAKVEARKAHSTREESSTGRRRQQIPDTGRRSARTPASSVGQGSSRRKRDEDIMVAEQEGLETTAKAATDIDPYASESGQEMKYEGEDHHDYPDDVEPVEEEIIPDAGEPTSSFMSKLLSPFATLHEKREQMQAGKLAFLPDFLQTAPREGPREEILTSKFQRPFKYSTENPFITIVIFLAITAFFFFSAVSVTIKTDQMPPYKMKHKMNIQGEMSVYLPDGHEATNDLNDVREYWSTDMIVIYVEIENPDEYPLNITESDVLREMSYVEETLDWNKEDRGIEDDCIFALSISTIVKEINSTPPRLYDSLLKNTAEFIESYTNTPVPNEIIASAIDLNATGEYAIPDEQERIDAFVENLPENLQMKLVADTNGDGIWDAAVLVIGMSENVDPGEMIIRVDEVLENRPNKQTNMIVTGPVPLTDFITNESFRYYGQVMPVACTLVVLGIMLFHKSFKAVLIAGGPTGCAVIWIYGFISLIQMPVTPTVIVLGPILLALGVSYGLHLANRIAQEPDPDPVVRAQRAIATTGNAVFMSAVTTMIGFVSLAFGTLMPVTTVGVALTIGILFCFLLSMFMSPAVAILVNYRKKTSEAAFAKAATIPTRHAKKIIGIFLFVLILSVSMFPLVETDTNIIKMAPSDPDINGYDKIRAIITYSEEFNSGALGMTLVNSAPGKAFRSDDYENDAEDPVALLDQIEVIEDDINDIVDDHPDLPVNAISIVTIMKTIGAGGTISLEGLWNAYVPIIPFPFPEVGEINFSNSQNFWDILHSGPMMQNKAVQKYLLNVFYDALSKESRGMVINQFLDPEADDYYKKTLIYVDMPVLSDKETHDAVFAVNDILVLDYGDVKPTKLTGVAAVAVAVNDLLIESQKLTLALSIFLVILTLSFIFGEKGTGLIPKPNFKLGLLTSLPVMVVVGFEPLVMILAGVSLNLATVMIGSTVIGAGVDFSVHITQRTLERGMNIKSVENSVEKSGMALIEATVITIFGLTSAFLIPITAIYSFVLVIMILLVLSAVAAMFFLPAIYVTMIGKNKGEDAIVDEFY